MASELRGGHTLPEVALPLRVLALFSGNASRAAKALSEAGLQISTRTLSRRRVSHHELYWDMRREADAEAAQATLVRALAVCELHVQSLRQLYKTVGA